jgi:hypothetical protein
MIWVSRNMDFTPTLASHVDDRSPTWIIEGPVCAIDEAAPIAHLTLNAVDLVPLC